ncbi:MAG TPA: CHAD domain-containing protein [Draconibacterium sp.]|nr:CHAD domain-containing protein [Draconibacterium sp.]
MTGSLFNFKLIISFVARKNNQVMPHNTGKRLVEALSKQLERIEYFSSAAYVSPNLAVHEMRKTFKRMRALVRFYIEYPEEFPPEYRSQIKYFGRSFSVMRESFVNIQIFERIAAENNLVQERKIRAAREKLTEKNKKLIEKGFFEAEGYLPVQNFGKLLAHQLERFEIGQLSLVQFVRQLEISYDDSYSLYNQIWSGSDPELMHELRKKMKRLMYQYDFIRYMHPRFFKSKTFQLNNITEQLGEDHDLFIFLNELKSGGYDFNAEEFEILENKVNHLREVNHVKLFPRLKQFFIDNPEVYNKKLESIFKVSIT